MKVYGNVLVLLGAPLGFWNRFGGVVAADPAAAASSSSSSSLTTPSDDATAVIAGDNNESRHLRGSEHIGLFEMARSSSIFDMQASIGPTWSGTAPPNFEGPDPYAPSVAPSDAPSELATPWERITFDDFDFGWGNFEEVANPKNPNDVVLITENEGNQQQWVYEGFGAIRIRNDQYEESSVFHEQDHDLTGYARVQVDFWFSARSMELDERFFLEYSYNGGVSWTEVKKYKRSSTNNGQPETFTNSKFYYDVVTLEAADYILDTTQAKIRFRCHASGKEDYVYIDKVEFRGQPYYQPRQPGSWETITEDDFENGYGNMKEVGNPQDPDDVVLITASNGNQQDWVKQGSGAVRIRGDRGLESSVFHKDGHDVTAYSQLRVSFWFSTRSLAKDEKFFLEYTSKSIGANDWKEVKKYERTDFDLNSHDLFNFKDNSEFYFDSVVLTSNDYNLDTIRGRIRFRSKTDVDHYVPLPDGSQDPIDDSKIYIDKVLVEGLRPAN